MQEIRLKAGRDSAGKRRHPWIFSGAVDFVTGEPQPGETVLVRDGHGQALGLAAYSPHSQIRARYWTYNPQETIELDFFRQRLLGAWSFRQQLWPQLPQAFRWVNAEGDGLPGLVVDVYGEYLVLQSLAAGVEAHKGMILQALQEIHPCKGVLERSDAAVREKEGLPQQKGLLAGSLPPGPVLVDLAGICFGVDLLEGHKTGHYLDQRLNWQRVGELAQGKEVLNCFGYTGGFALAALQGGAARVTEVELSASANEQFLQNLAHNGFTQERVTLRQEDVFKELRLLRDQAKSFDLIILDPPKFAESQSQLDKAARGYKDINLLAMKLLRPGGILASFSCSGAMDAKLFQKILSDAALDAGRRAHLLQRLGPAPDHALELSFPEGDYLKGLLLMVQ